MTTRITVAALGTAALLMSSGAAVAQARFADVDRDGNGRLSYAELEARFGAAAADRLWSRVGERPLSRADVRRLASADGDDDDRDDDRDDRDDDDRDDDDRDDDRDDRDDDGRDDDDRDDDDRDDRDDGDDDDDGADDDGDDDDGDDDDDD